jgi:signal transduction histidine kinase
MPIFGGPTKPSGDWEAFLGAWERANLVRSFFWSQRIDDEKLLLTQFLARLRRFFSVDFCFAALQVSEHDRIEAGVPEAGLAQLANDFAPRCLESLANSRAPVAWNEAGRGGFRSTVVAPLRAPTGGAFGFLMLGHARPKSYSAVELFLLQELAGELSWVVRDLAARKRQRQKSARTYDQINDGLQTIIGNAELMRERASGRSGAELERHIQAIESAVRQIGDRIAALALSQQTGEQPQAVEAANDDIATAIAQSVASSQRAKERGIEVEVVYTPTSPDLPMAVPPEVKRLLNALVDHAALATRNERVRLMVQRDQGDLQVSVRGTGSNRVADKLKSMFEAATRWEGARDESGETLLRVREYLDHAGGDVYLKSHPGEAAEFVVRLPIEGAQAGRPR